MSTLVEFGRRTLSLSHLASLENSLPSEGYIVLLPAYSESENVASLSAARFYMGALCREYCCVGTHSADLEDQIDILLEDIGLFLPTTSFQNVADACDYFLNAADGGAARYLFAPVADHQDLLEALSTRAKA